jgi:hydroxyacylglutathione hydrolase
MPELQPSPVRVTIVPVTAFGQNASVVVCAATGRAMVVDPGGDLDRIGAAIAASGATVERIVLTHGHVDHAAGAAGLAERLAVPVEGPHAADAFLLADLPAAGRRYGIPARAVVPRRFLEDGDAVTVGAARFAVLHCPGHTPGHIVLVEPAARLAIVGDTLFAGSVGRTDFPYGDHGALLAAIRDKLLPLNDAVVVLPGHGPSTTIGRERRANPYLR